MFWKKPSKEITKNVEEVKLTKEEAKELDDGKGGKKK